MPQQQSPFLEGKYGWNFGESGWNTGMDENLLKFSFMFDRNVDGIVSSLPSAVNGQSYYLDTDNRLYFAVGTTWYSSPVPKWFEFKIKSTGETYQFNGSAAVQIESPVNIDSRLDAIELTLASLGTAAFQDTDSFATQSDLDIVEAQSQSYTDDFKTNLADEVDVLKGANLVGYKGRSISDRNSEMPNIRDMYLPEDGNDWLPAFNRAIATGRTAWYFPGGAAYGLSGTVFWPVGFQVVCEPRVTFFRPLLGATLTDGFLMMWNTADGSTWSTQFPNHLSGGIYNASFDNPNSIPSLRGVKLFAPVRVVDIKFNGYTKGIERPAGLYIDSTSIKGFFWENFQSASEYAVDIQGFGDGLVLEDLHFPYNRNTEVVPAGIRLRSCNGGVISAVIGGDHLFEQCRAVNIVGMHNEQGQVIFSNSCGTVQDFAVYPTNRPPFIARNDILGANAEVYKVTLRDGYQIYQETAVNPTTLTPIMQYDGPLAHVTGCMLVVDNVFRAWGVDGALSRNQLTGVTLADGTGAAISDWNNFSYLLSRKGTLNTSSAGRVSLDSTVYASDNTFTGISTASQSGFVNINSKPVQWNATLGTYYYKSTLLYDTTRLIGRQQTAAEWSVSVDSTAGMVRIYTGMVSIPRTAILRIYRGTSAGSYNKYVDIPIIGGEYLYDTGNHVCGRAWVSRTAGGVDAVNDLGTRTIRFSGVNVELRAGAVPTTGSWTRGDYVDRINSTISGGSLLIGNKRLTTGSGHVSGTDWAALSASAV